MSGYNVSLGNITNPAYKYKWYMIQYVYICPANKEIILHFTTCIVVIVHYIVYHNGYDEVFGMYLFIVANEQAEIGTDHLKTTHSKSHI